MLSVAGRLDPARGGPADDDLTTHARSLYVQTARWDRSNFATLFDAANPDASVEKRDVSTVAPQSLFLLNHEFVAGQAKHLAERLIREVPTSETEPNPAPLPTAFSRPANAEEVEIAWSACAPRPPRAESGWRRSGPRSLCSNEFVYLD